MGNQIRNQVIRALQYFKSRKRNVQPSLGSSSSMFPSDQPVLLLPQYSYLLLILLNHRLPLYSVFSLSQIINSICEVYRIVYKPEQRFNL
jgi:hypothetical protein